MTKFHIGKPSAWIEVTGEDSFSFLQGQFTNDLRGETGICVYGLWLNRKGKVLADSLVWRAGEEQWFLLSTHSPAAVILERLESYIIADDVELTDRTGEAVLLSLWGAEVADTLERAGYPRAETGRVGRAEGMAVFPGRRFRAGSFEVVFHGGEESIQAADEMKKILSELGAEPVDQKEMESVRIRSLIPAVPIDIGPDDLPQEGGLEEEALSYQKGCYLGQEVMARLRAMGQARRALVPVRVEGEQEPSFGAPIHLGEKTVGHLRSLTGNGPWQGLAMARRDAVAGELQFSLEPGGQPNVYVLENL